ncbi:MAG: YlmC/YmxH family sporulation protein [Firmicutes bacterium]|nr:YlmC/YmxH family sporulation protein [Bacillota bacterium]
MDRFDHRFSAAISSELSFCELRCKEVINVVDGKRLGRICDILFSRHCAKVLGFVVPGCFKGGFFRRQDEVFIPFNNICKIGCDVILVELKNICTPISILNMDSTVGVTAEKELTENKP